MIQDRIFDDVFDDIPSQMKLLKMAIPISFFLQKDRENVVCRARAQGLHKTTC